ncbi:hypothetical protein P9272_07420 [Mesorhizobium sp. WSM4976]|uniref:hypothetical protein n=1 Tax=Mesorhizobium sp. WSM4976 TaxID=3038549 RepID=UPI002416110B|nr:hypothetical protein [Mesorhizobium sp. WSM4976]MDG4893400.1 hypothetical protein [Mesorhizobium sp. WSM4976]
MLKNDGEHLRNARVPGRADKHLPIRLPQYWRSRILDRQAICPVPPYARLDGQIVPPSLANIGFSPTVNSYLSYKTDFLSSLEINRLTID